MRISSTLMTGAVAAVVSAGSANAAIVWQTFDSLSTSANAGAVASNAGNNTFLTAYSSVSITADSWSSNRVLYAGEAQSRMQVTGGIATFTAGKGPDTTLNIPGFGPLTIPGNDGRAEIRYQSIGTRNLTDFQFRLNVTGVTGGGGTMIATLWDGVSVGTVQRTSTVTATGAQVFDFTGQAGLGAIQYIAFEFVGTGGTFGSTRSVTVNSIQYVPAPSALALLGAAGLVGARRRRG